MNEIQEMKMPDGIYLIRKVGDPVLFESDCNTDCRISDCIAVGIKSGSKSIAVALKDAAGGKKTTLTDSVDKTYYNGYIDNRIDAVVDWNGENNTKHLIQIGLSCNIKLAPGQYIPAVGEMDLIYLYKKALNKALKEVGGEPITSDWYWTSTELSATYAWYLNLDIGRMYNGTKSAGTSHVRPVSKFICK